MSNKYKKWSGQDLQFIQDNLQICTDKELAVKMSKMSGENISSSMIRRQRRKLGVEKQRGRPRFNRKSLLIDKNDNNENNQPNNS